LHHDSEGRFRRGSQTRGDAMPAPSGRTYHYARRGHVGGPETPAILHRDGSQEVLQPEQAEGWVAGLGERMTGLIRRSPLLALGSGVAVGFLLARLLGGSKER